MYAIVKTGGKQYKVAPGDVEHRELTSPGDKVELEAICVVDGAKVEADLAKAPQRRSPPSSSSSSRVRSSWSSSLKRKNYKKLRGHRQQLTRVQDRVRRLGQG